jgi:hypothetical protein
MWFYKWKMLINGFDRFENSTTKDLEKDDTCLICRAHMEIQNSIELECHQCFHEEYIEEWSRSRMKCPICSKTISIKLKEKRNQEENILDENQIHQNEDINENVDIEVDQIPLNLQVEENTFHPDSAPHDYILFAGRLRINPF